MVCSELLGKAVLAFLYCFLLGVWKKKNVMTLVDELSSQIEGSSENLENCLYRVCVVVSVW